MARGKTDIVKTTSGAAFELVWSANKATVRLRLYSRDGSAMTMVMPSEDLADLRKFLDERVT